MYNTYTYLTDLVDTGDNHFAFVDSSSYGLASGHFLAIDHFASVVLDVV